MIANRLKKWGAGPKHAGAFLIRARERALLLLLLAAAAYAQTSSQTSYTTNQPACAPVSGDRITGRDLAAAVPQLAALSPDLNFGYAPTPGVIRTFLPSELQKLAIRYGIDARPAAAVCFAWPLHQLTRQEILAALQQSLAGRKVELDIADQCRMPAPPGEIVFPIQGLREESSRAALWTGYIRYADDKKFSTWVQVRVTVQEDQIVAARPIRAGELVAAADVKTVVYRGALQRARALHQELDAIGKCARTPIAAGTVLAESMFSLPQEVERQQLVTVHIHCGAAHIETQGIAVEAGYRGDVIKIRNPKTGKIFRAQIDDQGVVTVVPGGDVGLVVEDKKS